MVAMLLTALVAVEQPAWAQEATAALPGNDFTPGTRSSLPEPLEQIDADRYRQIFKLQASRDYRGADALIADLTDQSLLGHVLADRYLSRAYKSSPKELADWLKQYSGQPDAEQVYQLALRKGAENPTKPKASITRTGSPDEASTADSGYWQWGLENWRSKRFTDAAQNFSKAAGLKNTSSWDRAASRVLGGPLIPARAAPGAGQPLAEGSQQVSAHLLWPAGAARPRHRSELRLDRA